jgi:transposase-like protein
VEIVSGSEYPFCSEKITVKEVLTTAMGKQTITGNQASRIVWDNLEEWVRRKVQEFIQSLLEEEIVELLGRQKSERRKAVDGSPAYRNGYGKERKLTLGCGTITLHRPRVRGLEERFESRVLPLFARRAKGVSKLISRLYLHGLSLGDFDLALRGCSGIGQHRRPAQGGVANRMAPVETAQS